MSMRTMALSVAVVAAIVWGCAVPRCEAVEAVGGHCVAGPCNVQDTPLCAASNPALCTGVRHRQCAGFSGKKGCVRGGNGCSAAGCIQAQNCDCT